MAYKSDQNDDEISRLLQTVVEKFVNEDRPTRERQIRQWRRLKLYWAGISQIYWDEVAQDYRAYDANNSASEDNGDQDYYDRPVNVFKSFLETVIAALSVQI